MFSRSSSGVESASVVSREPRSRPPFYRASPLGVGLRAPPCFTGRCRLTVIRPTTDTSKDVQGITVRNRSWSYGALAPGTESNGRASATQLEPVATPRASHGNDDRPIMTTFRWPNSLGNPKQVAIFGEFNNWEIPVPLNRSAETKDFFKSFALRPGLYEYKYVVDGEWCLSPCEPTTSTPDGQFNNRRLVTPSAVFHWAQGWGGKEVFLTGDFCGWGELLPLYPDKDAGGHTLACSLAPGVYNFLYLVDGKWMTAPDADVCPDCHGRLCNRKHVKAAAAFHVFYSTSWRHPILHYRCILEGSSSSSDNPKEGWAKTRMVPAPCRQPESSSRWMTAVVPAPTNNESRGSQQLEFFIEDKESKKRDLAPGGSNYACQAPGGFKLSRGKLLPFARVTRPPVMVVSDLDGTMVGDSNSAERSTQAFCNYWENNAALAGSVLVYNTGRSLGQFVGLWQHKNGALALPDVVICAVGTKICMLGDGKTRATATGHKWREDMSWRRILDYGWDLGKVRRVVESAMHRYHDVNWLDNGSEHPHRCSVSCSASVVDELAKRLKSGFDKEGVQVKVIVSGYGDWRYVDCVATRAGKQEALEYVRTLYGIPRDQCIAFGDSGNDTLMLEGKHPAVIVGNSQPTLVDWYSKQSVPDTGRERVIFADGNYAWGILEGLARHGLY